MKKLLCVPFALMLAQSALANTDKLALLDVDNDGRISIEEAASDASLSAIFSKLDLNKDGYLTLSELNTDTPAL